MNRSKKLFNLLAVLTVAAMFTMVGCDDNGDDPDPQDALVGSWEMTNAVFYYGSSVANADSSTNMTADFGSFVLTFNADLTGMSVSTEGDSTETDNFTYTATATEITVTEDGETEVIPYELSGNTLTLTIHEAADAEFEQPEGWIVITLAKQ